MEALRRMVVKELQQLRRDRRMIPILIAAPIFQLLVLGYAANLDVEDVRLLLVDQDRTESSRQLADRFVSSGWFRLVGREDATRDVAPWFLDGRAQLALVIPAGHGDAIAAERIALVQVLVDGTDNTSAGQGLGYATQVVSGLEGELWHDRIASLRRAVAARSGTAPPGPPGVETRPRVWYNPELRSRWFFTPAILAMVLMLVTMVLPAMAVVREREVGTLEQLSVTPLRPWQVMLGKLLPFALVGLVDLLAVTSLVVHVFGVPLRSGLGTLVLLSLPFLLVTLGIGLFVSTLVRTQQQAMMASTFFGMVPMIYLSGLIFPIENMPEPIRLATHAIPLRYYADILRGVFLKGNGLTELWPDALALLGFAGGFLLLATLRFRKSLE